MPWKALKSEYKLSVNQIWKQICEDESLALILILLSSFLDHCQFPSNWSGVYVRLDLSTSFSAQLSNHARLDRTRWKVDTDTDQHLLEIRDQKGSYEQEVRFYSKKQMLFTQVQHGSTEDQHNKRSLCKMMSH